MRRVRLPFHVGAIGLAVVTACAPAPNVAGPSLGQADLRALAREALARLDRTMPEPRACGSGWAESPTGYVVAAADWAEQAGLRPGDRIVAVGDTRVADAEERERAYAQVPARGPFVLGVIRHGQSIRLSLPCRHQAELLRAERRTLEAASRGDWDGCMAAAREARRLAGFTAYLTLVREHGCARARNPATASPEGREFAALHHALHRTLLRESRYVPGGTANVRGTVLRASEELMRLGFPEYAVDLERELQASLKAVPRLQLTWTDNANDEVGFVVERKIGQAGTYLHLTTLPANTTTYDDMAVEEGITYCYRVRAFSASRSSDFTREACGTPRPSPPPPEGGGGP